MRVMGIRGRNVVALIAAAAIILAACTQPEGPAPAKVDISLSAQYLCIPDDTSGYVTVADYSAKGNNGVYSFNPSSPADGFRAISVSPDCYPQDVVLCNGYLYVANYATYVGGSADNVLKIAPSTGQIVATIALTKADPVGLLVGSYRGATGVFVAESGTYDANYRAIGGAIDFIADGAATAINVISGIPASRVAALDSSTLVVSGGYPAATHVVDIAASPATGTEVTYDDGHGTISFGSSDVDILGGKAYVPAGYGSNKIYVVTKGGGKASVISVGSSTDFITNVGVHGSALYAVDDANGHVFKIDDMANPPGVAITTTQSVATEIGFGGGRAFVAAGSYNGNKPGLYCFNLSAPTPVSARVGE